MPAGAARVRFWSTFLASAALGFVWESGSGEPLAWFVAVGALFVGLIAVLYGLHRAWAWTRIGMAGLVALSGVLVFLAWRAPSGTTVAAAVVAAAWALVALVTLNVELVPRPVLAEIR